MAQVSGCDSKVMNFWLELEFGIYRIVNHSGRQETAVSNNYFKLYFKADSLYCYNMAFR